MFKPYSTLVPVAFITLLLDVTSADVISIENHGFEARVVGPAGGFILSDIPSWDFTGQVGTFKPAAFQYPGGIPEGVNVAALGNNSGAGSIYQMLTATLQASGEYDLSVDIGRRSDFPFSATTIELLAGSDVLASSSITDPGAGGFERVSLSYIAPVSGGLLGQSLGIRFVVGQFGQANFDNVTLTVNNAVAVPEPRFAAFYMFGIIATLCFIRRYQSATAPDVV